MLGRHFRIHSAYEAAKFSQSQSLLVFPILSPFSPQFLVSILSNQSQDVIFNQRKKKVYGINQRKRNWATKQTPTQKLSIKFHCWYIASSSISDLQMESTARKHHDHQQLMRKKPTETKKKVPMNIKCISIPVKVQASNAWEF